MHPSNAATFLNGWINVPISKKDEFQGRCKASYPPRFHAIPYGHIINGEYSQIRAGEPLIQLI
jgi:hypothetical protein